MYVVHNMDYVWSPSWIYLDEKSPSPDIHFKWVRGPDSSLFVMVMLVLTSELLLM